MRIVCISDTHTCKIKDLPEGDVLVHAGDLTYSGKQSEIEDVGFWLRTLPYSRIITVAGNHDWGFSKYPGLAPKWLNPNNDPKLVYLYEDSYNYGGISFFGSPYQPVFFDWAFNVERGPKIRKHWQKIPTGTDVVITHGPPYGILDMTAAGDNAGCQDLLEELQYRVNPKLHVFGHLHEAYGQTKVNNTVYVNASICTLNYKPTNKPIVVEL